MISHYMRKCIFRLPADKRNIATQRRIDRTGIDDRTVFTQHIIEDVIAVHEVVGLDIQTGRNNPADINHGGRGKKDPSGHAEGWGLLR